MRETPTISGSAYANTTTDLSNYQGLSSAGVGFAQAALAQDWLNQRGFSPSAMSETKNQLQQAKPQNQEHIAVSAPRRIVEVYIADPSPHVPLDKALLYSGEAKHTDLTDQELFFEIDIKSILEKYNAYRATLINKSVKERTEYLEPVRIRDLKMVVVTKATF